MSLVPRLRWRRATRWAREITSISRWPVSAACPSCPSPPWPRACSGCAPSSRLSPQPEVARGELRTALAFAPSLVADPDTPEVVAAWLETQRAEPAAVTLSLFPAQSPSGPWIDGLAVTESARSLRPGLHLAQYAGPRGVASAWLLVDGQASLVLPASYRRPVLQSITDPATRDGVEALVAAATPDAHAVYVTVNGGLWLLTPEGGEWMTTEIAPALGEPVEPPSTGGGNNKNKNKNKNKGGDR